ncbi:MAG: NAD+ synthase [Bacteroidota bacterium]|nr:NAD+ synthase [Bacteroidota bacterium]
MNIALAQFNPIVGDLTGNAHRTVEWIERAREMGADLVVFPELSVVGYSPHDLLDNVHFIDAVEVAIRYIHAHVPPDMGVLVGAPVRNPNPVGKKLLNAAVLLEKDIPARSTAKMLLPTYDVYDEYRYFEPAERQEVMDFRGMRLGVHICEDMWNLEEYSTYHIYDRDPVAELVGQGVDVLINLSASPWAHDRHAVRTGIIKTLCQQHSVPFVMVNQVGANTELIFDGDSSVHGSDGQLIACAPSFEESLLLWHTDQTTPCQPPARGRIEDLHDALVLGIREYVDKTGAFDEVLIGLSGGIDSAVTAALAVEALGPERVTGITMPSVHSSEGSVNDSVSLARNLGIAFHELPIKGIVDAFETSLAPLFEGTAFGVAEENIQARSRGVLLMAVANKFSRMVLTTGNKSELAMGYATLYGDMSGGLAVLADVFKMDVYALARFINERAGEVRIPVSSIEKPPSAELRPDQKDEDSLPPYPLLDDILQRYIEERQDEEVIAQATGQSISFVRGILDAVDRNEYKRKQAPPGLRVSVKGFGSGRRMPIVARVNRKDIERMMHELQEESTA